MKKKYGGNVSTYDCAACCGLFASSYVCQEKKRKKYSSALPDIIRLCRQRTMGLGMNCKRDLGTQYVKFDVGEILTGWKAVSCETKNLATKTKDVIKSWLESIDDSTVAMSIDMYTNDFKKKAYLDVHRTWVERDFKCHHAVLAIPHFGNDAHTTINISTAVDAIVMEFGLSDNDTPVTTDHGLNSKICLVCLCHRLQRIGNGVARNIKMPTPTLLPMKLPSPTCVGT